MPTLIAHTMKSSVSTLEVSVPVVRGAFLSPGSAITIAVLNATVISPANLAGTPADISATEHTTLATVKDSVANIMIGFTEQSLIATVDEGKQKPWLRCYWEI